MSIHHAPPASNRQTLYIALALTLGIIIGESINLSLEKDSPLFLSLIDVFNVLTDIFLRLVKMIIAPLVFATLVVGMAKMGDVQTVGRIAIKALLWFFSASLFSLLLGMLLVNFFKPGLSLHIPLPALDASNGLVHVKPSLASFTGHMFPKSIVEAMANNEILQIVIFAMFFGIACASLGELARPTVKLLDSISHIMLKITAYVMLYAPVAVFSAITAVIAENGIGILATYGQFIGEFYFALILLCSLLLGFTTLFIGARVWSLLRHIR